METHLHADEHHVSYRITTCLVSLEPGEFQMVRPPLRARSTNVVHDLGFAEPRSKVEPSSR